VAGILRLPETLRDGIRHAATREGHLNAIGSEQAAPPVASKGSAPVNTFDLDPSVLIYLPLS
jgi:hypothetical protein